MAERTQSDLPFSGAKGRSEVTLFHAPPACQCVSLACRPADAPINWLHSGPSLQGILWRPSPIKVTTIKARLFRCLCAQSQQKLRGISTGKKDIAGVKD